MLIYIVNIANNLLENAKSGILTGFGIIVLIYSVSRMLILLENTFNDIWNVKNSRSLLFRLTNYISLIFISPIFLIFILVSSNIMWNIFSTYFGNLRYLFFIMINLFNMLVSLFFIMLLFILVPNKRVQFFPALVGSVITYTGLVVLYKIYSYLQFVINNYNVIYGSLAFIPIFLIWIKYFWTIVLIGAQITYTIQTSKEIVDEDYKINFYLQKKICIYLLYIITKKFEKFENSMDISELKEYTGIPKKVINSSLRKLQNIGLINEILDEKNDRTYYQVNKNPDMITVEILNDLLEEKMDFDKELINGMSNEAKMEFLRVSKEIEFSNNKLIKDI